MTVEHLTLIEPNDLRAVRIICNRCRGALSLQLTETLRIPPHCPSCHDDWESHAQSAHDVANALKRWMVASREKQPPFVLRFEITETK